MLKVFRCNFELVWGLRWDWGCARWGIGLEFKFMVGVRIYWKILTHLDPEILYL